MSYSFNIKAATKEEAITAVSAELDKVVASQPVHAADRDQVISAAASVIELVSLPDDKSYAVSVSGSLGWNGTDPKTFTFASINVSVSPANA